jgi:hypothetical protein
LYCSFVLCRLHYVLSQSASFTAIPLRWKCCW